MVSDVYQTLSFEDAVSVDGSRTADLAGNANEAPTTASATTHAQGRPSFAKLLNCFTDDSFPCICLVALAVVWALLTFPAKLLIVLLAES